MATNQEKLDHVHGHVSGGQQEEWMRLLARRLLNEPVARRSDGKPTSLGTELSWWSTNIAMLQAEQKATREVLLTALASQTGGVNVAELVAQFEAAADRAFEKNLKGITADVTLTVAKES